MKNIQKFLIQILDLIFPEKCIDCGKVGDIICDKCYLKYENLKVKNQNEKNFKYLFKYDDIRKLILDYKFNDKSYLYKFFAEMILRDTEIIKFIKEFDYIISVPLSHKRLLERGYNQTDLIMNYVCNKLNENENIKIQNLEKTLVKIKHTKPQSKSNKEERQKNIIGVYKIIDNSKIINKKILIFDDIYTTRLNPK